MQEKIHTEHALARQFSLLFVPDGGGAGGGSVQQPIPDVSILGVLG